ncbi:MAG: hypothetical protein PHW95_03770 [Patescibacteria group bacterium]|nr:hypothetical protein [Patescibacteria group bacterium]
MSKLKLTIFTLIVLAVSTVVSGCQILKQVQNDNTNTNTNAVIPVPTGIQNENQNVNLNENVNADTSTTTAEIDTPSWKTYRNDQYGFEFKYPKSWEYKISSSGIVEFRDSRNSYALEGSITYLISINVISISRDFSFNNWRSDLINIKDNRGGVVKEVSIERSDHAVQSSDYLGVETDIFKNYKQYSISKVNLGSKEINAEIDKVYFGLIDSFRFIN